MKKIISLVTAAATAAALIMGSSVPASADRLLKGDVNGDGNVTLRDASLAQKIQLGLLNPSSEQQDGADMDGSASVELADAYLIQRLAAHEASVLSKYCPNRADRLEFYDSVNSLRTSLGLSTLTYTDGMMAAGQELSAAFFKEADEEGADKYSNTRSIQGHSGEKYDTAFEDYCLPDYSGNSTIYSYKGGTLSGAGLYEDMMSKKDSNSKLLTLYNMVTQKNLNCLCVGDYTPSVGGSYWVVTGY